eukprot:3251077-Pyramimonas_sp.AAC.1
MATTSCLAASGSLCRSVGPRTSTPLALELGNLFYSGSKSSIVSGGRASIVLCVWRSSIVSRIASWD